MLSYEIDEALAIAVIEPSAPLAREDFEGLARAVDEYIEKNGNLSGILVHARSFPGWEDFGALVRHLTFVRNHHREVRRVAVAADGFVAKIAPKIATHFVSAEVRHFGYGELEAARNWIIEG